MNTFTVNKFKAVIVFHLKLNLIVWIFSGTRQPFRITENARRFEESQQILPASEHKSGGVR